MHQLISLVYICSILPYWHCASVPVPRERQSQLPLLQEAADRLSAYWNGYLLDPLFFGNWSTERLLADPPETLPRWTAEEAELLKQAKVRLSLCWAGMLARFLPHAHLVFQHPVPGLHALQAGGEPASY